MKFIVLWRTVAEGIYGTWLDFSRAGTSWLKLAFGHFGSHFPRPKSGMAELPSGPPGHGSLLRRSGVFGSLKNIRAVRPEVNELDDPPCPPATSGLKLAENYDVDDDPIITPGACKRLQGKEAEQVELQKFLSKNRFQDVNSPQKFRWFHRGLALCGDMEELYPIHVAAKLGKPQLVKSLLRKGVDKETVSSHGRSPLEAAQQAKDPRSRIHVIHILQGTEMFIKQTWSVKDLLTVELNSTQKSRGRYFQPGMFSLAL